MNPKIWLSSPHMGTHEFKFVKEAFEANWIAPLGPHVNGFEYDLEQYTGAKYAAALSAGTAALHLALIMLGVSAGDDVICQSLTFSASANPIAYLRATPVFVDSEPETCNMNPELLEKAIVDRLKKGKNIKAIIPVHLYGMPAKMERIMEIANKYEIPVVEDAAEALGSSIHGKAVGTYGVMSILSFNGNKIITTSGGGALISNDEKYIKEARFLATQARDVAPHYQHSHIGYNYRMSNVCAAIGRGQMIVLDERIAQRRRIYETYLENFGETPGVTFWAEPEGYKSNRWLTTILVDPQKTNGITRETIRLALEAENIESRPLWKPMHLQPIFSKCPAYVDGTSEMLFNNGLCLPSGSNMSNEQIGSVITALKSVLHAQNIESV